MTNAEKIESAKTALGIELGSTRIKAVLIDEEGRPLAAGGHDWENKYENGIWTYELCDVWAGLQHCYAELKRDVQAKYGKVLKRVGSIGISAMMHGYMVFDEAGELLAPFRTWRNNNAAPAAEKLSALFGFHIPARWSVAHLYQSILNGEEHVSKIRFQTTLEGYVHWKLTGEKVIGIGEASGMFPIDSATRDYHAGMVEKMDGILRDSGLAFGLRSIFPRVLAAGERAGVLTEAGARLLDPTGDLQAGILLCPPEGDAGTGMVATNAVRPRTGNVSAGTSVFAMIVLERELSKPYDEIDLVTTPVGDPVGMVHCNNCTSDLNGWVGLFEEFSALAGIRATKAQLYDMLYHASEEGDADCGGLLAYNYVSNEHITKVEEGRPLFVRTAESAFNLKNFMRAHLYAALGALKVGCDKLLREEGVRVDAITGHGGLFKTERVGQRYLAAALGAPVTVMKTAGEGGAWGSAILAAYTCNKRAGETLADYLENRIFAGQEGVTLVPDQTDVAGFEAFIERYKRGLPIVREAVKSME